MATCYLDSLALKYGTSKSSVEHDYCPSYERWFADIKDKPITLFEIGIQYGASHRMWAEWMPNARIFGLDVAIYGKPENDRVTYIKGSQSDPKDLAAVVAQSGPLDVIIDDGSHVSSDIFESLKVLWPHLKPGGMYVVEDLHVGTDDRNRQARGEPTLKMGSSSITALEFFKSLGPYDGEFGGNLYGDIEIVKDNLCLIKKP